ncbi:hypothetical protein COP1_012665 [Malus domestica]
MGTKSFHGGQEEVVEMSRWSKAEQRRSCWGTGPNVLVSASGDNAHFLWIKEAWSSLQLSFSCSIEKIMGQEAQLMESAIIVAAVEEEDDESAMEKLGFVANVEEDSVAELDRANVEKAQ